MNEDTLSLLFPEDDEVINKPVTDMESAERTIAMVLDAQFRIEQARSRAKEAKSKIDQWLREVEDEEGRTVGLGMGSLTPWLQDNMPDDRRLRHIDTIAGRVGMRRAQGRTTDHDKDETLAWYRQHMPSLVREETVYKLETKEAKKKFFEDGKKAPTIEFQAPYDRPYVEET